MLSIVYIHFLYARYISTIIIIVVAYTFEGEEVQLNTA